MESWLKFGSQWAPMVFSPLKSELIYLAVQKKKKSHIGFFPVGKAKWKPLKLPPTSDQEGNSKPIWHLQGKGEGDGRD